MKLIMENWRKYLNEYNPPKSRPPYLGQQVWSGKAPEDSKHRGTEEDTDLEKDLYNTLKNHLNTGGEATLHKLSNKVPLIKNLMKDPRYNDVFFKYQGPEVCRGTSVPLAWAYEHIPNFEKIKFIAGSDPLFPGYQGEYGEYREWSDKIKVEPFEWMHPSKSKVSSWSTDPEVCYNYVGQNVSNIDEGIGLILFAKPENNLFLDLKEIYKFGDLKKFSNESEVIGLESIIIDSVKVYKEVSEEQFKEIQSIRDWIQGLDQSGISRSDLEAAQISIIDDD